MPISARAERRLRSGAASRNSLWRVGLGEVRTDPVNRRDALARNCADQAPPGHLRLARLPLHPPIVTGSMIRAAPMAGYFWD